MITKEMAAQKHAAANAIDPYAYTRIMHYMNNGLAQANEVHADAVRVLKNAPANPVMIAAAVRAGLL